MPVRPPACRAIPLLACKVFAPACAAGLQGQTERLAAAVMAWKALPAKPTSEAEWQAEERQLGPARGAE